MKKNDSIRIEKSCWFSEACKRSRKLFARILSSGKLKEETFEQLNRRFLRTERTLRIRTSFNHAGREWNAIHAADRRGQQSQMWCQRLFEDVRACTCFYQNKDVTTTHGHFFNDTLRSNPFFFLKIILYVFVDEISRKKEVKIFKKKFGFNFWFLAVWEPAL